MQLTHQGSRLAAAALVKELRHRLQLSQEGLARRMGVSYPTVNRWENGHSQPSPMALKLIELLLKQMGPDGADLLEIYFAE